MVFSDDYAGLTTGSGNLDLDTPGHYRTPPDLDGRLDRGQATELADVDAPAGQSEPRPALARAAPGGRAVHAGFGRRRRAGTQSPFGPTKCG